MKEIGLYIHIPFCKRKCNYCDFVSFCRDEEIQNKYIEALLKNIEYDYKKYELNKCKINTIYIGGGTPSFIDSKLIIKVLNKIKELFNINEDAEVTIEVNPGTVTETKIKDYISVGINRISIGCQAVQDELLEMLGRIHSYNEFNNTYKLIKECGINNINVDLMIGLPNQKIEDVEESLNKIIKLDPNHISVYSLIVEEGTEIEKKINNNELVLPDEILERKMYKKVKTILEKNNYKHYEISNFAKEGFESKHNMNCWKQEEYVGFGLASHSYFNNERFSNIEDINLYIENIENSKFENNRVIHEKQTDEEKKKEYMLLGLRKINGVSISEFEQKFRINPLFYFRFEISKLEEEGLLEVDLDNIKLTKRGLDLANQVWQEFV